MIAAEYSLCPVEFGSYLKNIDVCLKKKKDEHDTASH
jgi:hypothetical protein